MISWEDAVFRLGVIVFVQATKINSAIGINKYRFMELKFKIISDSGYHFEQAGLLNLGHVGFLGSSLELKSIRVRLSITVVERKVKFPLKRGLLFQLDLGPKVETLLSGRPLPI